jgi:hypothetical protein
LGNFAEKNRKNQVPDIEEEEEVFFESTEARLRNLKHLEMAYEWLRNRRKPVQLKRAIESL